MRIDRFCCRRGRVEVEDLQPPCIKGVSSSAGCGRLSKGEQLAGRESGMDVLS